MPSCKILPQLYNKIVTTGCYEFLDNYNTYWLTLLFLVLLNFIIVLLALNQADLFRKSYAYDELLQEDHISDKEVQVYPNGEQYEIFRTKSSNPNAPIDAFEMHGYTKNNPDALKNHRGAQPNYKLSRA